MYYNKPFNEISIIDRIKKFIKNPRSLNRIIVINVAVWLFFIIAKYLFSLTGYLMNDNSINLIYLTLINKFYCPASLPVLLLQPWSIFTSIFIHADFWHLFFNMIMLYVMGNFFLQYYDSKRFYITFIAGAVFGNLFYMLAFNTIPAFLYTVFFARAVGASGGIMAIMSTITFLKPNEKLNVIFLGSIKLLWIMIVFIIIDVLSIPDNNAGGHFAHLGGAIYGTLAFCYYKYANIESNKKKRKKNVTSYDYYKRPVNDEDYNARKKAEQNKIDEILDKISKYGYDALTKAEKELLFNYGKKK